MSKRSKVRAKLIDMARFSRLIHQAKAKGDRAKVARLQQEQAKAEARWDAEIWG